MCYCPPQPIPTEGRIKKFFQLVFYYMEIEKSLIDFDIKRMGCLMCMLSMCMLLSREHNLKTKQEKKCLVCKHTHMRCNWYTYRYAAWIRGWWFTAILEWKSWCIIVIQQQEQLYIRNNTQVLAAKCIWNSDFKDLSVPNVSVVLCVFHLHDIQYYSVYVQTDHFKYSLRSLFSFLLHFYRTRYFILNSIAWQVE